MVLLLFVIFSVEAKASTLYTSHIKYMHMHNFQNGDFVVVFTIFSSAGLS